MCFPPGNPEHNAHVSMSSGLFDKGGAKHITQITIISVEEMFRSKKNSKTAIVHFYAVLFYQAKAALFLSCVLGKQLLDNLYK